MKDEDFHDLLDEVNAMSNEEYDEYHKKALNIKENEEMTEESMFCYENGEPLPRKNKFDNDLYKKVYDKLLGMCEACDTGEIIMENGRLKAQIEKMKCCMNCKTWRYDYEHYPLCAEKAHFAACKLWELKE